MSQELNPGDLCEVICEPWVDDKRLLEPWVGRVVILTRIHPRCLELRGEFCPHWEFIGFTDTVLSHLILRKLPLLGDQVKNELDELLPAWQEVEHE